MAYNDEYKKYYDENGEFDWKNFHDRADNYKIEEGMKHLSNLLDAPALPPSSTNVSQKVREYQKVKKDKTLWDSGLNIVTKPKIIIDYNLLLVCATIQSHFPSLEFSILVKGNYTEEGFHLTDDYVIPKQEVTRTTIDYEELDQYQSAGYNAVIHSHHNLGTFFSPTDEEFINCHFPCSVLYSKGDFKLATLSFHVKDNVFILETDRIIKQFSEIPIPEMENIKKRKYKTYKRTTKNNLKEAKHTLTKRKEEERKNYEDFHAVGADCLDCNYAESEFCQKCYNTYETDFEYDESENDVVWERPSSDFPCAIKGDCPHNEDLDYDDWFYPCSIEMDCPYVREIDPELEEEGDSEKKEPFEREIYCPECQSEDCTPECAFWVDG